MKKLLILIASVALVALIGLYTRQLIHETIQTRVPGQRYLVSLGDSVAAGAGLNGRRAQDCDLSEKAYPLLIGAKLHEPVEQFACSGATVAAAGPGDPNTLAAQLPMAKAFIPGSDVTITAGANDIGWLQLLSGCTRDNCTTNKNRTDLAIKIQKLQHDLSDFLGQLQQSKPRTVVVNTYYDLLTASDTCAAPLGINADEIRFITDEEQQLNAAITQAASQNGAMVVTPDFSGHLLCAKPSWLQGIKDAAPLHPTAAGQAQIAAQDLQQIK